MFRWRRLVGCSFSAFRPAITVYACVICPTKCFSLWPYKVCMHTVHVGRQSSTATNVEKSTRTPSKLFEIIDQTIQFLFHLCAYQFTMALIRLCSVFVGCITISTRDMWSRTHTVSWYKFSYFWKLLFQIHFDSVAAALRDLGAGSWKWNIYHNNTENWNGNNNDLKITGIREVRRINMTVIGSMFLLINKQIP